MSYVRRLVLVNAGLVFAGAVAGAVAAVVGLAISLLMTEHSLRLDPFAYAFAAEIGATLGAVGAPLLGWLVLRHVPLGRAFGWAAAGTVIGGALGWLGHTNPIAAGGAGMVTASIAARMYSRRRAEDPAAQKKVSAES